MNWVKKEKPVPILTAEEESKQWLADLTQKLREQGLRPQTETPSADARNEAAIRQSVRQHIEGGSKKE